MCKSRSKDKPNNQKATRTDVSAPLNIPLNLALYIAHDEPGEPGRGRRPEEDGDLESIAAGWQMRKPINNRTALEALEALEALVGRSQSRAS